MKSKHNEIMQLLKTNSIIKINELYKLLQVSEGS